MVRSFAVAFMAVSAGGQCVDKATDSDCLANRDNEFPCKRVQGASGNKCEWIGFCVDKATDSDCLASDNEISCKGVQGASGNKCEWVGKCMDKATDSDCLFHGDSEIGCKGVQGASGNKCEWYAGADDDDCTDVEDYADINGNVCAHYANNPDNCKHSHAQLSGSNGQSPCQACCACNQCPEPTCASHSCPQGHNAQSSATSCGDYGDICTDALCCVIPNENDDNTENDVLDTGNSTTENDDNNDSTADVSISNGIHGAAVVIAFVAVIG